MKYIGVGQTFVSVHLLVQGAPCSDQDHFPFVISHFSFFIEEGGRFVFLIKAFALDWE